MPLRIGAGLWIVVCGALALAAQAPRPASSPSPTAPRPPALHKTAKPSAPPPPQVVFDATSLGSPLLLDKGWHVGISADPGAAAVGFDDSTWAVRDAQAALAEVDDEDAATLAGSDAGAAAKAAGQLTTQRRYAWFRLHVKLAPRHGPLALLIELPVSQNTSIGIGSATLSPDIFANGRLIVPEGSHGSAAAQYQQISRIYDLDIPPDQTALTLVFRTVYVPFGYGAYTTFFSNRTILLGAHDDLARELTLWNHRSLFERLPRLIYSSLLAVLAIFLFALYFAQKGHSEYLWLALHELVQAPIGFVELAGSSARLDSLWYAALLLELLLVAAYLFFEFLIAFLTLRRRWYINVLRYTAPALALVGPLLLFVGHNKLVGVVLVCVFLFCLLWMLGWCLFIFATLIAAALKRNFEAALLLVPLILSAVGLVEPLLTTAIGEENAAAMQSPLTLNAGPIPIHFASIADFAGIFVIILIIFVRFLRIQRNQERATNELAAARSVQELLIPAEKPSTPGFEVDSVYSPANEVGGDFFHVQTADGGMLVVIGDVAGKGLKAAMNVSMLMGALRRTPEHSPAQILRSLNKVLSGAESFTTCQALWFGANGEMVLANAGHLPPYLNSQEIAVPGGLPLGVLPDLTYDEARFYLHPGDRILLMSDGVVEARQPSGELFGFDRVRNFSQQSAFYIAEAAKSFGQQDDITVLTVRRKAEAAA